MTELQLVAIIKPARIGGSNLFRRSNKSGREEGILDKLREHDYARKNHLPDGQGTISPSSPLDITKSSLSPMSNRLNNALMP